MDYDDEIITELTTQECWEALRGAQFGRLAYRIGEDVDIAPVNYAVEGDTLLFMTAEGSKLLGVVMNPRVAFEIDRIDGEVAHSVVVQGRARLLEEDEAHRAENVALRSWTDTLKYNVVEIVPDGLTGRRFKLNEPQPGTTRQA
jgi:nitroimidazol reductase NimA-like FMN-containing flavoprotein (pyridoxamine 5'-phosphate oxidase superfamily)